MQEDPSEATRGSVFIRKWVAPILAGSPDGNMSTFSKPFSRSRSDHAVSGMPGSYLEQLDTADRQEASEALQTKTNRLKEKIETLKPKKGSSTPPDQNRYASTLPAKRFYTWGNSGLEPNLGSGNQLSSTDEAQRGLCNQEGLQWSTMSD